MTYEVDMVRGLVEPAFRDQVGIPLGLSVTYEAQATAIPSATGLAVVDMRIAPGTRATSGGGRGARVRADGTIVVTWAVLPTLGQRLVEQGLALANKTLAKRWGEVEVGTGATVLRGARNGRVVWEQTFPWQIEHEVPGGPTSAMPARWARSTPSYWRYACTSSSASRCPIR